MLIQLHWQWIKNGKTTKTEMKAQREIDFSEGPDEMKEFVKDVQVANPLPRGAVWMACHEGSGFFVEGEGD